MGGKSGQDRCDVREVVRDAGLSRPDWHGENLLPSSGSAPFLQHSRIIGSCCISTDSVFSEGSKSHMFPDDFGDRIIVGKLVIQGIKEGNPEGNLEAL